MNERVERVRGRFGSTDMGRLLTAATLIAFGLAPLIAQDTSISWVRYQVGCPVVLENLTEAPSATGGVFESVGVKNVSAVEIDEVAIGILAGSNEIGTPRELLESRMIALRLAPGEQRRIPLGIATRDLVTTAARRRSFLITLGVLQVRRRGSSLWVSPAAVAGDFAAVPWPASVDSPRGCRDARRRSYPLGAVLVDAGQKAQICRPDGTWGPR